MAGKKMNYSKKRLLRALDSVKEGRYKICEAAKIFQIPRQTLADKIRGRRPAGYCKPGPQAVLGADVESRIESWLLENSKCGFPLSREGVEFSVRHIIDQIPESARTSIPFKNNTPGKGWFKSFQKRHPQVRYESPFENKSVLTEDDLKRWHDHVEKVLEEKSCSTVIDDPNRIWVMNEFIVAIDQVDSVSPVRRIKSKNMASKSYSENTYTVFLTTSARCEFAPPLIITKNSKIFDRLAALMTGKWGVLSSESCLLNSETFYQYVVDIFYPHLIEQQIVFPIVVFVNEDFFCTSLPLMEFCQLNDIIFLGIPKNATQFLNPLNTTTGFPLEMLRKPDIIKVFYDSACSHPIVSLVDDLLSNVTIKSYIIDKFYTCNIYPFRYTVRRPITSQFTCDDQNELVDYFESKIPPEVFIEFHNCKLKRIPWNGPKKYQALYDFWQTARSELKVESRDPAEDSSSPSMKEENLDDFIVEEEEIGVC